MAQKIATAELRMGSRSMSSLRLVEIRSFCMHSSHFGSGLLQSKTRFFQPLGLPPIGQQPHPSWVSPIFHNFWLSKAQQKSPKFIPMGLEKNLPARKMPVSCHSMFFFGGGQFSFYSTSFRAEIPEKGKNPTRKSLRLVGNAAKFVDPYAGSTWQLVMDPSSDDGR